MFNDTVDSFRFRGVPFYGFDFDLSVEMLAVAVALMPLTLSLRSASGFLELCCFRVALRQNFTTIITATASDYKYFSRLDANWIPLCGAIWNEELGYPTVALNAGILLIQFKSIH